MRIIHITTDDNGGAGLCCLRIHQALLEMGIESKVVTLRNSKNAPNEYCYGRVQEKLSRIPSKLIRMFGLTVTERNTIMNLRIQKGAAYSLPCSSINLLNCKWVKWADVVHLHWVNNYLDIPSFLRGIDKPVVWTLHDENFFYGISHYSDSLLSNHPLERKYAQIKRKTISQVEKLGIVMLSEYFLKKFGENELLHGRKVKVINNPIDTEAFKPIDKKEARAKLGLSDGDILIGFMAGLIYDERKGLKILLQAIEEMANPNIKILAIGGNPENVTLPNMIPLGTIQNTSVLSEALSAIDFFAMPSYQEAFAQSPMEAMACGKPIVVFPVSGTSELVNEQNGVICDSFTPKSLRLGIETLMGHQYDSVEIRQDMINRFSPRIVAQKYIDFYEVMINGL